MLNAIIDSSLNNRFFVLMATLLVAGVGVYSALHLPIDAVPDLTNVQVQVITEAPALSPLEVDSLLVVSGSGAMSGLPDVEQIRSVSKFGVSVVTIVFKEGTDIYRARQLVGERLPRAAEAIPDRLRHAHARADRHGAGRGLSVPGQGDQGVRAYADGPAHSSRLVHRLPVARRRGRHRDQRPRRRDEDLSGRGRSRQAGDIPAVDDRAVQRAAVQQRQCGRRLSRPRRRGTLHPRREPGHGRIDDIAAIVIDERNGVPVTVRDVAKVYPAPMIRAGLATRDGQGEIVTGLVMMLIGQNGREVVNRVKAEIEELKKSLPPGVTIEPLYDRTHLINQTLNTVLHNLTAGGILVMVVLLALLGNLRGGLIVALAIPLSMLFAANVMLATGHLGQPDEPGRDRFRPDRRLQRDHDRELRAPAGA